MSAPHRNAWLRLSIGGKRWGIYLVSEAHRRLRGDPDETVHAICYHDECRIYVARGPQEVVEELILHEIEHALYRESGASYEVADEEKEERIVRDITPLRHRVLRDLGFRFPKVDS